MSVTAFPKLCAGCDKAIKWRPPRHRQVSVTDKDTGKTYHAECWTLFLEGKACRLPPAS